MGNGIIPLIGFALGTGIDLVDVVKGGLPGILLGLITVFIGGGFIVLCDKFLSRRPGYAGWAVATTAGNAVAVPAAVALADPAMKAIEATATVPGRCLGGRHQPARPLHHQLVGQEVWLPQVPQGGPDFPRLINLSCILQRADL